MFGVQKSPVYGTYGEFTVGSDGDRVRAQFLLTKMKPGSEGTWENELASQMVPWREVFDIEELTFDELLQRDLDDSRVAHDLIPYLLGEKEASARFFPPILAVLVPKNNNYTGIQPYYPEPKILTEEAITFGDLFDFNKIKLEERVTPIGEIKYNRQRTAFVIADGQHRAMAILALHRQINKSWGADRYASFYNHISLNAEQIKHIELPVCIIFLPDLHEANQEYIQKGIDLKRVCREIFLVVNKTAKRVSQSRELLLDDEDFAARMMRTTLSKLKGRGEESSSIARIYSFAFGDSESDLGKQVVSGQLQYSSAVALYKMHAAVAFGNPDAFNFDEPSNITDGRSIKNTARPVEILRGTLLEKWQSLSRTSAKYYPPSEVELAVDLLATISDIALIKLFDRFKPFTVQNAEMRALRTRLLDSDARADLIQSKCYSLMFEGSGVRNVFEEHRQRLLDRHKDLTDEGKSVGDYITNQLNDANAVVKALDKREDEIKKLRAAQLFNIDYKKFFSIEGNDEDIKELLMRSKSIFDTISTQAFQLGYLMTIHSVVELILEPNTSYDNRIKHIKFISNLYIDALNIFFSSNSDVEHYTLNGLVNESRIKVFDTNNLGLRKLLILSGVKELNERQWVFFRYAILEIVHSKYAYKAIYDRLNRDADSTISDAYKYKLPSLIKSVLKLREEYILKAIQAGLNSSDFKREIDLIKAECRGQGRSENEIEEIVKEKEIQTGKDIRDKCEDNIKASLGEFANHSKIIQRIILTKSLNEGQ
ncbi:DNA sulfur modification protein DndB [Nostoc parmelioides]|uniref:DGQHR domain-containing protein n=1 Tax=Nostoc parmelioides FACHB-3921 TaxID=2692909 RepID=A0ABR8BPV3_9NOSO|nr:DNA sulfur modification protein DndB [Nostoc parmelioides]MBD2255307.1 hypothetical protein [Nostoc parmelioides FACHB-3921]